jgi:nucleoside-diphosphate-sugar epimerase
MHTAFVAGATGYTGREVVRVLAERGVRTLAHVRPDSARLAEWRERFTALGAELDATPWQRADMIARLAALAPTHVFALLGTTSKRAGAAAAQGRDETYEAVDYGLTRLLIDALVDARLRPRFVYLSAAGTGPRARGAYLQARWRVEEALRASGLPYTIARPSFITGADRDETRVGERVGAALADGFLSVASALGGRRLAARYRSTTNTVLATALVTHALEPAAESTVLESEALRG